MVLAETYFTSEAAVLPVAVAALALQVLSFNDLTTGLVFELIILAQSIQTKTALEDPSAMIPNTALTLDTLCVPATARARVRLQALAPVAHPSFTKITDSSDHLHPSSVLACMLDDAVSAAHHALLFTALCASRQPLNGLAEVAECPVFLTTLAFVALHVEVGRQVNDGPLALFCIDILLP